MSAQRQSDREMDRAARSLVCLFGLKCRRGLDCFCGHTDVEKKLFADRKAYREKEWMAPCGFCAVGRCRYGAECQRNIRSRLSNEAYRNQRPAAAESESDYASAESGSDSGEDSTDVGIGLTSLGLVDTKWRCNFLTFALIGDAPSGFTHA